MNWQKWPWRTYPVYVLRSAVIFPGGEGVRRLLNAAKSTPYYHNDEVYLSCLLPEKANMNVTYIDR